MYTAADTSRVPPSTIYCGKGARSLWGLIEGAGISTFFQYFDVDNLDNFISSLFSKYDIFVQFAISDFFLYINAVWLYTAYSNYE